MAPLTVAYSARLACPRAQRGHLVNDVVHASSSAAHGARHVLGAARRLERPRGTVAAMARSCDDASPSPSALRRCIGDLEAMIDPDLLPSASKPSPTSPSSPPRAAAAAAPSAASQPSVAGRVAERQSGREEPQSKRVSASGALDWLVDQLYPRETGDWRDWAWMWGSCAVLVWMSSVLVQMYMHLLRMGNLL